MSTVGIELMAGIRLTEGTGLGIGERAIGEPGVGGWGVGASGGGLGGCTSVHCHAVGLLEPLLMGLFAPPVGVAVSQIRKKIAFVLSRFDTGRVTKRVLDRLLDTGHPEAAFQLTEGSTRYAPDFRFSLAFNAKLFEKAFAIASTEFEKSKDARYRARLLAVGQASIEAKKFELARKAFDLAADILALVHLYVVANYKTGLLAVRKMAEEQTDKFTIVLIDNLISKLQDNNGTLSDPPGIPNLYCPTTFINVSMRMGGEFLSPLNLNSLSRWLTTANANTISAIQHISPSPAGAPLDNEETKKKQDLSLVPPKRFGSLRANQQKLSSKTTLSSSSTIRRTPSSERIVSLPNLAKRNLEELLVDEPDVR